MPLPRPTAARPSGAVLRLTAVACLLLAVSASAQRPGAGTRTAVAPAPAPVVAPVPQPSTVTFAGMAQAVSQVDYTVVQLRRFPEAQGQIVSVRERVVVDADGSDSPPFDLTYLGVEGELPGSPVDVRWQQTYARYGSLFHKHASFSVRDLGAIQQNYTLHDFGPVVRAGRQAIRTVVFPQAIDKSIWVVDVDAATMLPLCWAEFDFQFRLLAEVEAVNFTLGVVTPITPPVAGTSVQHPDYATAKASLVDPAGILETPGQLANYAISTIETRDDPLNGQQKLVTTYTDGLDQFMIVQMPGTTDVFASLAAVGKSGAASGPGHTIARFQDKSMRVLLFWEDGVSFQVAGRGSLTRLDDVAKHLYLQALSTN